ncbi:MAG: phosphatidate cytidylyltransferase [Bacteroidetes bacterium]|nr:phosphatidate cytidylyltransferase [Bacteroidota bacterium]
MSNFWQRTFTGAAFVIVMLGAAWLHAYAFICLFLLIALTGLKEYSNLMQRHVPFNSTLLSIIGAIVYSSSIYASHQQPNYLLPVFVVCCFVILLYELFAARQQPFSSATAAMGGLMYVVLPFVVFVNMSMRGGDYNFHFVLCYFILQWTSDTGQYLAGRSFGRSKLFERISPKKSWEGLIGGLILTIAVAWYLSTRFDFISKVDFVIISIIIVVFGTLGDLIESMLKRSVEVKDSGNIMPGHGGILDRFDALIGSAPFVYFYLELLKPLLP